MDLGIHGGPGANPPGYQGMTVVHLTYFILIMSYILSHFITYLVKVVLFFFSFPCWEEGNREDPCYKGSTSFDHPVGCVCAGDPIWVGI